MKRVSYIVVVILICPLLSFTQVELVPQAGYMFGGTLSFYEGDFRIQDGASYGGSIIVPDFQFETDLEINYTRMDSEGRFRSYYNRPEFHDSTFKMSTNYIQVGVLKTFGTNDQIRPFGSLSLGTTIFSPKNNISSTWRFSVALGAGAKIYLTDRVGIILRGRLLMPMYFGGVGFYVGSGGSGLSLNSYATMLQGDFSGGLIFSLGR